MSYTMTAANLSGENNKLYSPSSRISMANRPWASVVALSSAKEEYSRLILPSLTALWQQTRTGTPATGDPFRSAATPAITLAAVATICS
jgi:hypothetical protein